MDKVAPAKVDSPVARSVVAVAANNEIHKRSLAQDAILCVAQPIVCNVGVDCVCAASTETNWSTYADLARLPSGLSLPGRNIL